MNKSELIKLLKKPNKSMDEITACLDELHKMLNGGGLQDHEINGICGTIDSLEAEYYRVYGY